MACRTEKRQPAELIHTSIVGRETLTHPAGLIELTVLLRARLPQRLHIGFGSRRARS